MAGNGAVRTLLAFLYIDEVQGTTLLLIVAVKIGRVQNLLHGRTLISSRPVLVDLPGYRKHDNVNDKLSTLRGGLSCQQVYKVHIARWLLITRHIDAWGRSLKNKSYVNIIIFISNPG
jgi:hypothetical protein